MRILVFRGGALGDFIVTLPALRRLRQGFPGAELELVGHATAAALAPAGLLDRVHSQHEACWAGLHGAAPPSAELAQWLRRFDLVVSFLPDGDGTVAGHLVALGFAPGPGPRRLITAPPLPARAPAAAHFCSALDPLGLPPAALREPLAPPVGAQAEAARLLPGDGPPWLAWHPGSGAARKNWPADRWAALWRDLSARFPFRLVATLGEVEEARGTAVPPGALTLRGLSLPVLAAVYARCRLFVGHDTGPAHVAAGVGTPCLLLFGPTDPTVWAPPGDHVTALRAGPDLAALSVDAVAAAVAARWG